MHKGVNELRAVMQVAQELGHQSPTLLARVGRREGTNILASGADELSTLLKGHLMVRCTPFRQQGFMAFATLMFQVKHVVNDGLYPTRTLKSYVCSLAAWSSSGMAAKRTDPTRRPLR